MFHFSERSVSTVETNHCRISLYCSAQMFPIACYGIPSRPFFCLSTVRSNYDTERRIVCTFRKMVESQICLLDSMVLQIPCRAAFRGSS